MTPERLKSIRVRTIGCTRCSYETCNAGSCIEIDLLAEIDRLNAKIEKVKAVRRVHIEFRRGFDDDWTAREDPDGSYFDADAVLDALEES